MYIYHIRTITLILLLFLFSSAFSQDYANKDFYLIDSLNLSNLSNSDSILIEQSMALYHHSKTDTGKITALNILCEKMVDDKWMNYQLIQYELTQKALERNLTSKEKKFLLIKKASALRNIGIMKRRHGNYQGAIDNYKEGLSISKQINDSDGIAISYNNLGLAYKSLAQTELALKCYHASIKIDQLLENKKQLTTTFINIASIYKQESEFEIEKQYLEKALVIAKEIGYTRMEAVCLNSIGVNHAQLKNIDEAFKAYDKSIAIHKELGDKRSLIYTMNNKALLYKKLNQPNLALDLFNQGLLIAKKRNYKDLIAYSHQRIGLIYFEQKEYKKALKHATKSYEIAIQIRVVRNILNSSRLLSNIYEATNQHKKALEYYQLTIKMSDSISNESTQKAAIQQQAKYEYEKQKAIDDSEHEKQLAIEQEAKEKQQILTVATGAGLGLVGIFLIFVFNRLKVTRKQKGIIELAHSQLEEKNTEILDSISYAKRIQSAILPPGKVVKEYLQESFIFYKPKDIVAGDFYWLETISDEGRMMSNENSTPNTQHSTTILFAAADCTGHGVPGAMVSVVCNNGLNRAVREHGLTDPGKILDKTREIVVAEFEKSEEEVKDGMDIALCSLSVDSNQSTVLKYAGAHNPLWIIRKDTDLIEEIKANKQPIGKFDHPEPYTTHTLKLLKGDTIYIFSDGYADQFGGEKGKKLKTTNFKKLLLSIQQENMQKQKELVNEAFENWKGKLEQLDDVCVIGVKI